MRIIGGKYRRLLFIVIFLIFAGGGFSFYLYKLHALAVGGSKIFEYRCTDVNPRLIGHKNAFLSFADAIKNPGKYEDDEVKGFLDDYITGMRYYIMEETKWLDMQKGYGERWDFQSIEPWYMKQAWEYQWKMYEADLDSAKLMIQAYDEGGYSDEINNKLAESRERQTKYRQLYFDFSDEATLINDWRKIFGQPPESTVCTEENMTIPSTYGVFDKEEEASPGADPTQFFPELAS